LIVGAAWRRRMGATIEMGSIALVILFSPHAHARGTPAPVYREPLSVGWLDGSRHRPSSPILRQGRGA
jgi:hypothetical protein